MSALRLCTLIALYGVYSYVDAATFSACMNVSSGTIRIVDQPPCRIGERPISLSDGEGIGTVFSVNGANAYFMDRPQVLLYLPVSFVLWNEAQPWSRAMDWMSAATLMPNKSCEASHLAVKQYLGVSDQA